MSRASRNVLPTYQSGLSSRDDSICPFSYSISASFHQQLNHRAVYSRPPLTDSFGTILPASTTGHDSCFSLLFTGSAPSFQLPDPIGRSRLVRIPRIDVIVSAAFLLLFDRLHLERSTNLQFTPGHTRYNLVPHHQIKLKLCPTVALQQPLARTPARPYCAAPADG